MPSTFFGLNIGSTGLYTYQAALNTTSHNVANAETEGYTRQIINQAAGTAIKVNSSYGMAGSGVDVTGVTQVRNEYYDTKFRQNKSIFGEYSAKDSYMTEIENYLNEVELEGFTTSFNSFSNNLQSLKDDPSSLTIRTQVVNYGKSLTDYFNALSTSLKNIQEECNFEVKNQITRINSIGSQIATLTNQINTFEIGGGTANDLRDQRALLVDDLSEIVNISVSEKVIGDGIGVNSYVVKINGQTLVDTYNSNTLLAVPRTEKANQNDAKGLYDITWNNGQNFNTSGSAFCGTLKALLDVRDGNNQENLRGKVTGKAGDLTVKLEESNINSIQNLNIPASGNLTIGNHVYTYTGFTATYNASTEKYSYEFQLKNALSADATSEDASVGESINYKGIPYYMAEMNEFVRTYSKAFNDIHKTGQDLNGNKGIDFFNGTNSATNENFTFNTAEDYYNLTAANFTVTETICDDPNLIAAASNITDGVEDKTILNKLAALKNDKEMFKQGTPSSFLQSLVAKVGIDTEKASSFSDSQSNILKMIDNQRLSISGVDADEEAINLIKFKNAYNLSAKVITTMNEIYNKLINEMGV